MEYEFTDRYQAMGIAYPDLGTCCDGQCEGTGWIPIHKDETDPVYKALWEKLHTNCSWTFKQRLVRFFADWRKALRHGFKIHWSVCFGKCDGWHFVRCPDCNGTGKKKEYELSNAIS